MEIAKELTVIAIDTETTNSNPHKASLLFYTTYDGQDPITVGTSNLGNNDTDGYIGHNLKYDAIVLKKNLNEDIVIVWDTYVAEYLLHIELINDKKKHGLKLESILKRRYNIVKNDLIATYNKATGKDRKNLPDKWWEEVDRTALEAYGKGDVQYLFRLMEDQKKELIDRGLYAWYVNVEIPIVNILVKSELTGVKVDREHLLLLQKKYEEQVQFLEKNLKDIARSTTLNINSTKQLQNVLFNVLHLPKTTRTKTGWSTDIKSLKPLRKKHLFVDRLLQYREIQKILGTYVLPLLEASTETSRVNTTFNQCFTVTRRFSSEHPNIQNIPANTAGKELRGCFVPETGKKFIIADYDQIELRLLAHLSKEEKLIKWFLDNVDIHAQTANIISKALGRQLSRKDGKILNFSLLYGKTAYGLSKDWGISEAEAQRIISTYYAQFPAVKVWKDNNELTVINNHGRLSSLAGLPLFVGDPMLTTTEWEYEQIMRLANNYPIQSSSQDILKRAIVNIYMKYNLVPVLMVHDELVYETDEAEKYMPLIKAEMESVFNLIVPLKTTIKISDKWEK